MYKFTTKLIFSLLILFSIPTVAQYQINGNSSALGGNCFQITPNTGGQVGSIWNTSLIDLNNSFDFSFYVNLGCDTAGADGICFGLQALSTSVGVPGAGMGLGTVSPSLGVYIDTYQNSLPDFDPWYDHISINSNGDVNHSTANNLAGPVPASATQFNVEDCINHTLRIAWNAGATNMQVWFDGVLRLNYTGNIVTSIFGGNPNVYWGFTGGTGLYFNSQSFCIIIVANFTATTVCEGSTTVFTDSSTSGTPITNWAWDFGDGSPVFSGAAAATYQNPTHTYATAGTYIVQETIMNSSGGTSTISHPVTVLALPTVTATGGITICAGQSVNLTGTVGGPSVLPATFTSTGANNNIAITDAGVPFGWTGTGGTFSTSVIPVSGLNTGWTFTGVTINITHTWDGDLIGYLIDPCGNSIQLIGNNGGSGDNFTNTTFTPSATAAISTGASPFNGTFVPSGGAAAWAAFIAATQGCASANGNWSFVVGDDAGGDVGTILNWSLNFSNPSTPTYVWAPTATMTGSTTLTPTVTPAVTTTYTLTATNSFGCSDTAQTTVTVNPGLTMTVNSPTICSGQTTTLTATGATTYAWSAGTITAAADTATVAPVATTSYTVTGTLGTCTGSAVSTVTVVSGLTIAVNSPTICNGQTATLTATGGTTYTWTAGATPTGTGTATATPITNSTYTVTGASGTCTGTVIATVTVNPLPTVTVNSPSICPGTLATLTATGASSYTWSAGATSTGVNTATASPTTTTTYTVTGTSLGCSSTAVSTVTMGASINITATGDTICSGSVANLTANGATTYTWSPGATSTGANTATASPSTTTTYTVTGSTAGCSGTATAIVTVTPLPIAGFTAPFTTPEINPTVPFTNTSINAASYLWNFGDLLSPMNDTSSEQNPAHTYTSPGTYCVHLTASNGSCVDSAMRCIEITAEFTFYIPNTFTPNHDGRNEEFYGMGTNIKTCETSIYNRWGELLFNTTDMNIHWNGKNASGEFLQSDVYVYVITVVDIIGNEHKYIGNITLLN
jgi:gliding motility-associated-like protein